MKITSINYYYDENNIYTFRRGSYTKKKFLPFFWIGSKELLPIKQGVSYEKLSGDVGLKYIVRFSNRKKYYECRQFMRENYNKQYYNVPNLAEQYMITTGEKTFQNMNYEDLVRLQFDLETEGLAKNSKILSIAIKCGDYEKVFMIGRDGEEKDIIEKFISKFQELDPDVVEGYNFFGFDFPVLQTRCDYHKIKLTLGKNNVPVYNFKQFTRIGDITKVDLERWTLFGRHVVDLYIMVKKYDSIKRIFYDYKLEDVIRTMGLERKDRVFLDNTKINEEFEKNPERVEQYNLDDVRDVDELSKQLLPVYFAQTKFLPMDYDDVCLSGTVRKISSSMVHEYYKQKTAIPFREDKTPYIGALVTSTNSGIFKKVNHFDFRSLYPTIMLQYKYFPKSDVLGIFGKKLEYFTNLRIKYKNLRKKTENPKLKEEYLAFEQTAKIFINAHYGVMGSPMFQFNDMEMAEKITLKGRELLQNAINQIKDNGGTIINSDTDGIYAVYDRDITGLPEGFEIEKTHYQAMVAAKKKHYVLLKDGNLIIRGAGLRSRAIEAFGKDFIKKGFMMILEDKYKLLKAYYFNIYKRILDRKMPIEAIQQGQMIKHSKQAYKDKNRKDRLYERIMTLDRPLRVGEREIYYYSDNGLRLADEFNNDYNITYLIRRLHDFTNRFCDVLPAEVFEDIFREPTILCNEEYKYVWLWHYSGGRLPKWLRKDEKEVYRYIEEHSDKSCYMSVQRYNDVNESKDEKYIMPIYFDLDGDLDTTRKETIALVKAIDKSFVPKEMLEIFFSGSKGFHIVIPYKCFGTIPSKNLNSIIKYMCKKIGENGITTLDMSYNNKKLLRIENTRHHKSGLYKIPLTFEELNLSIDEIKVLAKQPRIVKRQSPELSSKLKEWVDKMTILYEKFTPKGVKEFDFMPVCVKDLLDNSIRLKGSRNKAVMVLASFYKYSGVSMEEAIKKIKVWVNNIPKEFRSDYKDNSYTTIRSIYNCNNYHFACAYIRALGSKKSPIKCDKECKLK